MFQWYPYPVNFEEKYEIIYNMILMILLTIIYDNKIWKINKILFMQLLNI